jgi:hypothetical protein
MKAVFGEINGSSSAKSHPPKFLAHMTETTYNKELI